MPTSPSGTLPPMGSATRIPPPPTGHEYRATFCGLRRHVVPAGRPETGRWLGACGADTTAGAGEDWIAQWDKEHPFPICHHCLRRFPVLQATVREETDA